jgi:hypothetical protein
MVWERGNGKCLHWVEAKVRGVAVPLDQPRTGITGTIKEREQDGWIQCAVAGRTSSRKGVRRD